MVCSINTTHRHTCIKSRNRILISQSALQKNASGRTVICISFVCRFHLRHANIPWNVSERVLQGCSFPLLMFTDALFLCTEYVIVIFLLLSQFLHCMISRGVTVWILNLKSIKMSIQGERQEIKTLKMTQCSLSLGVQLHFRNHNTL